MQTALQQFVISSVRLTEKNLGSGAYGVVREARIPGAACAVKKMHEVLSREEQGWVSPQMVERNRGRFVRECELMSRLRHPNIVQFLGVCFLPGSDTPALVTEIMLTDLYKLLMPAEENLCKPYIPLGLKYSILRDIARGLFFLHSQSPPVIHRDLTATNVLLNSAMVAKIADLGVARLMPTTGVPMTKGPPGKPAYMPPEAQGSAYNESVDVFSFAVLTLFTLTQTFPEPLPTKYIDKGESKSRTEVQRRINILEQIRNDFKNQKDLVDAVEMCLDDIPSQRPQIQMVLELLEAEVARQETVTTHIEMNKLELVQAITNEREELTQQIELEQLKNREFQEAIQQKDREWEMVIKQKDRQCVETINRKDREWQEVVEQNEREWITQLQREKDEAVQLKEKEILDEIERFLEENNSRETVREDEASVTDRVVVPDSATVNLAVLIKTKLKKQQKHVMAVLVIGLAVFTFFAWKQIYPEPLPTNYVNMGACRSRTEVQHFLEQIRNNFISQKDLVDVTEMCLDDLQKDREWELKHMIEQKDSECVETIKQKDMEWELVIEQRGRECVETIKQKDREWELVIEQRGRECVETIKQKDMEWELMIEQKDREIEQNERDQLQREKDEAVQLREKKSRIRTSVMIIGSIAPPAQSQSLLSSFFTSVSLKVQSRSLSLSFYIPPEVVPQSPADLSDDDRKMLSGLGLPPDKWDNLNALLALYKRSEVYDVFSVKVSKPGMELNCNYILQQIEFLLMTSFNKDGAVIHYYGNSRRNTGDWCFGDGCITFRDIASLYMKHSRGRVLTLVPDCHSSGHWVSECAKFLDEQGVRPCGHSAIEKGILLEVYAACRTGQDTAELCYTTQAMELKDDGIVYHWYQNKLRAQQWTLGVDFTSIRCGKKEKEECSIATDSTWSTASGVISDRIFIFRKIDKGRLKWHYLLLDNDAEKIGNFRHKTTGANAGKYSVNPEDYGTILKSGWGRDPPQDAKDWLMEKYGLSFQ